MFGLCWAQKLWHLELLLARLLVKVFKTPNGRQSHILSSVNFTNRKNSAILNYHKSWSWSNQPVLWDVYIMFLFVSSLWMFVTIFCPKHGATGDVWCHNILTFHAASAENRREKSQRVSFPSGAEIHFNIILSTLWWNKKAFLYKVILTLRWCIEIISSFQYSFFAIWTAKFTENRGLPAI